MEPDNRLPTGEWTGFYIEKDQKGWMHLYLQFADGKVKGEGTDYVGPWVASGQYNLESGICKWTKDYLGQHDVDYEGRVNENGIMGQWKIGSYLTGKFHIWPKSITHFNELYLNEELTQQDPTILLGTVPVESDESIA